MFMPLVTAGSLLQQGRYFVHQLLPVALLCALALSLSLVATTLTASCYLSNNATRGPVPLLATAKVIQSHVRGQTNDTCDGVQQI